MNENNIRTEEEVRYFFQKQAQITELLKIISCLNLKEGCLCAGTLRNSLWNYLTGRKNQLVRDVDVIFFDPTVPYEQNQKIQAKLLKDYPLYDWEVKNQFYMHGHSGHQEPYTSVLDGISHFPERCTAIGARMDAQGRIELICPYGVEDILNFEVRPTPFFESSLRHFEKYLKRVNQKRWQQEWPQLIIQQKYNKKSH